MERANNTQALVVTYSTSSHPIPALTEDLNVEEVQLATIAESVPIPTEAMNPIPSTGAQPASATPTTEVDHTPIPVVATALDEGSTMRLSSMTPTPESELTQLSDTDIS